MQAFLSRVLGYIKIGFNIESKLRMMTAHNAAKSYNMLRAFDEYDKIDYSKICLTYGNLTGVKDPQYLTNDLGIQFTWTHEIYPDYNRNYDQVMILAFSPKDNIAFSVCSGSKRKSATEVLEIPSFYKGSEFHTWISFVSDDRLSISMSNYVVLITS